MPVFGTEQLPSRDMSDCAHVFRRATEEAVATRFDIQDDKMWITHSSPKWTTPYKASIDNMKFVQSIDGGAQFALTQEDANALECPAGAYNIPVGTSFGQKVQLVYVGQNFVLFDDDGRLAYMANSEGFNPLQVRSIWRSNFRIVADSKAASSSKSKSSKSKKKKKKKKSTKKRNKPRVK